MPSDLTAGLILLAVYVRCAPVDGGFNFIGRLCPLRCHCDQEKIGYAGCGQDYFRTGWRRFFIPNGDTDFSPGLAQWNGAYPGNSRPRISQPQRGCVRPGINPRRISGAPADRHDKIRGSTSIRSIGNRSLIYDLPGKGTDPQRLWYLRVYSTANGARAGKLLNSKIINRKSSIKERLPKRLRSTEIQGDRLLER